MGATSEPRSLQIQDVEKAPLRVTFMFQDGSVFTYFEQRDVIIGDQTVVGQWRVPLPDENHGDFALSLVRNFYSDRLGDSMRHALGDIVAVISAPREGAVKLTCPEGEAGASDCTTCGGSGYVDWPSE